MRYSAAGSDELITQGGGLLPPPENVKGNAMKNSLPPRAEQNLAAQIRVASGLKSQVKTTEQHSVPFVTLSRQYGCEAVPLAESLARQLDVAESLEKGSWQVYGRKLIEDMADQQYSYDQLMSALDSKARGAIEEFVSTLVGQISDLKLLHRLVHTMRATATLGRCIIVGRGGAIVTRDMPGGIHVRLVASEEFRIRGLVERHGWGRDRAQLELKEQEGYRAAFIQKYLHRDPNDPELYDLVLNSERLSRDELTEQVLAVFRSRRK
ncbi:MAG: cytidylate kinase-like family protein [Calditrichaeota bacterium]|nr:cytidylate kinase-like family protein [Calditrichota bacterium]